MPACTVGQGPGAGSGVNTLCMLLGPVYESPVTLIWESRGIDRKGGAIGDKIMRGRQTLEVRGIGMCMPSESAGLGGGGLQVTGLEGICPARG